MPVILAYIGVVLIWSTTPLAIVWSGEADWFFGVAARTLLGAILILPIYWWLMRSPIQFRWDRAALKVYAVASLPILGGTTLMYWAAQFLPSGWIAILFSLTSVMTGVMAHFLLPDSRLNLRKILGILLSLFGLWIIFAPNLHAHPLELQILAILAALLSVLLHSLGTVLVKRCNSNISSVHIVIGALWITALGHFLMNPTALWHWPTLSMREGYAIVYAASIGSVVGFLLYFYLLRQVDAMKVAFIPVITPIFALLIGQSLNNELLSLTIWLGTALVLAGIVLFEWRFKIRLKFKNKIR